MLHRVIKRKADVIYSGWDFNGDGRFPEPRIKGVDKRNRARYERTILRRLTYNEIKTEVSE